LRSVVTSTSQCAVSSRRPACRNPRNGRITSSRPCRAYYSDTDPATTGIPTVTTTSATTAPANRLACAAEPHSRCTSTPSSYRPCTRYGSGRSAANAIFVTTACTSVASTTTADTHRAITSRDYSMVSVTSSGGGVAGSVPSLAAPIASGLVTYGPGPSAAASSTAMDAADGSATRDRRSPRCQQVRRLGRSANDRQHGGARAGPSASATSATSPATTANPGMMSTVIQKRSSNVQPTQLVNCSWENSPDAGADTMPRTDLTTTGACAEKPASSAFVCS